MLRDAGGSTYPSFDEKVEKPAVCRLNPLMSLRQKYASKKSSDSDALL